MNKSPREKEKTLQILFPSASCYRCGLGIFGLVLEANGYIKLTDFGLSRKVKKKHEKYRLKARAISIQESLESESEIDIS